MVLAEPDGGTAPRHLLPGSAHAQGMGSIFGKVTDSSGGVMPGVTVTVTGTGLQLPLVAVTTETGAYQFPNVPIGTYAVTFELRASRRPRVRTSSSSPASTPDRPEAGSRHDDGRSDGLGRLAGRRHQEDDDRRDVRRADVLEKIPTARDPWQIINMTPGVQARPQRRRLRVGPAAVDLIARHQRERAVEPRRRIDHRPVVELVAVVLQLRLVRADPGDQRRRRRLGAVERPLDQPGHQERQQRVQGLGGRHVPERRDAGQQRHEELFNEGHGGFLSGAPINKITNVSTVEYGGPIIKNQLWFWGAPINQDINVGRPELLRRRKARSAAPDRRRAADLGTLRGTITYDNLDDVQDCLNNDKTVINNLQWKLNYQLNAAHKFQYLFQSDNKIQNSRGASATTAKEATTSSSATTVARLPAADALDHAHVDRHRQAGVQQPVHLRARRVLPRLPGLRHAAASAHNGRRLDTRPTTRATRTASGTSSSSRTHHRLQQPLAAGVDPDDAADARAEDRRHLLPDEQAGRRPLAEVRRRLAPGADR